MPSGSNNYFKKNWLFFLLLALAFLTRFCFLNYPAEVVFDEVHFGKFVGAYFTHRYYFDIHPPLGKMMIAGFAGVAGLDFQGENPEKIFEKIGGQFSADDLLILRFLPALFNVLLVALIYKLILLLGLSGRSAFLGSSLILFSTALLVQSKFILVDIFLLFFGFLAVYFFLLSKKQENSFLKNLVFLILCAVSLALSLSIKWTGLSFLGIILVWTAVDFFSSRPLKIADLTKKILIFILIPFSVYVLIFFIHFKILYKSGTGNPYMSQAFQKTLSGNVVGKGVEPASFSRKFIELNAAMYKYNKTIIASHPFSSRWHQWPLTEKSIWYWSQATEKKSASVYFLANPVIWFSVLFAVAFSFVAFFVKKWRKILPPLFYILVLGYFANLLPFILVSRVTFLYHYLASLIFGILIFVFLWEKVIRPPAWFYFIYLFALILVFLVLSPLVYGFPIPFMAMGAYRLFLRL